LIKEKRKIKDGGDHTKTPSKRDIPKRRHP